MTAQFDSAAGLYEDNVVAVLGMPVGKITKVTPKGGYVEAEFTVDSGVKIPADVHAVTISTSILTARQIELTPPYSGGPVLAEPLHHRPEPHQHTGGFRSGARHARQGLQVARRRRQRQRTGGRRDQRRRRIADGNGEKIKAALGELSRALAAQFRPRRGRPAIS